MIMNLEDKKIAKAISEFGQDILLGLSSFPKTLPSKYFYDEKGDVLFQKIMEMEEYYLTRCEHEILSDNKKEILALFKNSEEVFDLVEFGAGDGYKTKVLLQYFTSQNVRFEYIPVDISSHVLNILVNSLKETFPSLSVNELCDEYFIALQKLNTIKRRKIVLFMGANIGNFKEEEAISFLKELNNCLNPGDLVMIGFDLKKDPSVILKAYHDKDKITSFFNLNLLTRINKELNADFNIDQFEHYPNYCPVSGDTKSYLISRRKQTVFIKELNVSFEFDAYEPIYTELSKKYDKRSIERLARASGFEITANFFDKKSYFLDTIWKKD